MKKNNNFQNNLNQNIEVHKKLIFLEKKINLISNVITKKMTKKKGGGGKIFFCGNGGSAADAQHLAAEFLVRLRPKVNRRPYPAISLCQDTSTITACANDYSFEDIFLRNFIALSNKNDILIAISTSGNSKNILKILKYAKLKKFYSIGLLGNKGGKAKKFCTETLIVPSVNTARIQECHIFLGHCLLEEIENNLI